MVPVLLVPSLFVSHWSHLRNKELQSPDSKSIDVSILDFPVSRNIKTHVYVVYKLPSSWNVVREAHKAKGVVLELLVSLLKIRLTKFQ